MNRVSLTINGRKIDSLVEPRTHLADFLREQQRLTGTHLGCEHGVCGACTVLLDGKPVRSCITFAVACHDRDVRTIESFEHDPLMNELREAFSLEHGLQCGFCTPGMLLTSHDLCRRKPGADEREIRAELSGNLCRCTGYVGIVNAVRRVIDARAYTSEPGEGTPAQGPRAALAAFTPDRVESQANEPLRLDGAIRIDEAVEIEAPVAEVWKALSDIPTAASCLPGAEVTEVAGTAVKGRVQVKFGPMRASFSGAATIGRDDREMTGNIRGAGVDSLSKTRARGELTYRVMSAAQDGNARIEIRLSYTLTGPLAQFSRSGLVNDFAHRLIVDFGRNLKDRIARPAAPPRVAEIRAGRLLLSVLWSRLLRLWWR
jgi:carbon-monoxide dehydrogenase small subunit